MADDPDWVIQVVIACSVCVGVLCLVLIAVVLYYCCCRYKTRDGQPDKQPISDASPPDKASLSTISGSSLAKMRVDGLQSGYEVAPGPRHVLPSGYSTVTVHRSVTSASFPHPLYDSPNGVRTAKKPKSLSFSQRSSQSLAVPRMFRMSRERPIRREYERQRRSNSVLGLVPATGTQPISNVSSSIYVKPEVGRSAITGGTQMSPGAFRDGDAGASHISVIIDSGEGSSVHYGENYGHLRKQPFTVARQDEEAILALPGEPARSEEGQGQALVIPTSSTLALASNSTDQTDILHRQSGPYNSHIIGPILTSYDLSMGASDVTGNVQTTTSVSHNLSESEIKPDLW